MANPAIRLSVTKEVSRALKAAKKLYPALSDPEILKLGLSKIATESQDERERQEIMRTAAQSVGYDYLSDPEEDIYENVGTPVNFKR